VLVLRNFSVKKHKHVRLPIPVLGLMSMVDSNLFIVYT